MNPVPADPPPGDLRNAKWEQTRTARLTPRLPLDAAEPTAAHRRGPTTGPQPGAAWAQTPRGL